MHGCECSNSTDTSPWEGTECFTQFFAVEHDWSVKEYRVVCTVSLWLEWGWVFSDMQHAFNTWWILAVIHDTENLDIGPQGNVPCTGDSLNTQTLYFPPFSSSAMSVTWILCQDSLSQSMTIIILYLLWMVTHISLLHYLSCIIILPALWSPRLVNRKIIFCYLDWNYFVDFSM